MQRVPSRLPDLRGCVSLSPAEASTSPCPRARHLVTQAGGPAPWQPGRPWPLQAARGGGGVTPGAEERGRGGQVQFGKTTFWGRADGGDGGRGTAT